jgi:hypothetical protein
MNEEVKGGAGSTVESWLEEEGLLEEANAAAIKSVLAWQLREETDLLISGLRVEGSDRRNSGSRQLVVQKMGLATVDR